MECRIRRWRIEDANDIAETLNNKKVLDNLRDGIPFPYTVEDAKEFIQAMNVADPETTFSFAITVDGNRKYSRVPSEQYTFENG